jgi:endoglucanase
MIQGFISCTGSEMIDSTPKPIRLTGVSWYGFETDRSNVYGLDIRNYKDILAEVKTMGFNCIRLPFSEQILQNSTMPLRIDYQKNNDLKNKTSMQVFDAIISACGDIGLKIILAYFSFKPLIVRGSEGSGGIYEERLWYDENCSEDQWVQNWVSLASKYAGNSTVIGFDLKNEPHDVAEWGTGADQDWCRASAKCGNAIHAVNSDLLIIIQGIHNITKKSWWGGDLSGVKNHPVLLNRTDKLVYSPHEYGPEVWEQPWFSDPTFPSNVISMWETSFDYIRASNTAPILCGEFGIRDPNASEGKQGIWFTSFLNFMKNKYSWIYWSLNPESHDTGGLYEDDWTTIIKWKVDALKSQIFNG